MITVALDVHSDKPEDAPSLKALDTIVPIDPQRSLSIDAWLASGMVFAAEANGRPIGYAVFNRGFFGRGNVEMLMVAAGRRGQRIGDRLLEAVEPACGS